MNYFRIKFKVHLYVTVYPTLINAMNFLHEKLPNSVIENIIEKS